MKLSDLFYKSSFWDVDMDRLDIEKDADFIIPRVLEMNMGREKYFQNLEKLYPIDQIKHYALQSREIWGNENIDAISKRYGLNPLDFPKYIPNIKQYD